MTLLVRIRLPLSLLTRLDILGAVEHLNDIECAFGGDCGFCGS